jgi:hypothetical protein
MRIRLVATAVCVLGFTLTAAPARAQYGMHGEVSVLFWQPSPEITLSSPEIRSATGEPDVDFVETFSIEDKGFPEIRLRLGGRHKFRFDYVPVKYDEDTVITRTITVSGRTLTIGAPATADVKWDLLYVGYQWDFVSMEKGSVGVIGELKYQKLEAEVDSPLLTSAATVDQKAPVPTIGVAFRVAPIPIVAVGGEFAGLKISSSDFEAKLFDFDINGLVTFGPYIGVQGGYRSVTIDYDIDDDTGNLKLKGPYIGAVLRF